MEVSFSGRIDSQLHSFAWLAFEWVNDVMTTFSDFIFVLLILVSMALYI